MFGHFYNGSIRKYVVLICELFNNVTVSRTRDGKTRINKVPVSFASKERFAMKLDKINSSTSDMPIAKVETILPRINISLVDMIYNPQFKTNMTNRRMAPADKKPRSSAQFNPVPFKFTFEVGIYTRTEDDVLQIVEQIIPYFQPHFNCVINELYKNDVKVERDIPITFQSISMQEDLEGGIETRRRIEWTMIFELDGWLYPPINAVEGEIRTVYLDFQSNMKELPAENYESVDFQVDPVDANPEDWDGKLKETYSANKPIPVDPDPPKPRE
ncbi:MAG: tail sheath stabilizer and completion protein [Culicoidibacterales bacterium]